MLYSPYLEDGDDNLAKLCQVQIFFALLSSIALKYDVGTLANSTNIGTLLVVLTVLPLSLAFFLETPLAELCYKEQRAALSEKALQMRQRASRRPAEHGAIAVEITTTSAVA